MGPVARRLVGRVRPVGQPLHPWDQGFDHGPRACPDGLVIAPPDFVGIGSQKAGTSWWFDLIGTHPEAYHHAAYDKERHFLARRGVAGDDYATELSDDYSSWFPRPVGMCSGEWTPGYLYYYWVADLLHRVAPRARVLVLVRDPVERYLSGLVHQRRQGGETSPGDGQRAYERGFYGRQLLPWEALFPASRLLVLQYEQCVADPTTQLARTYRFLGLDDGFVPPGLRSNHVTSRKPSMGEHRRALLTAAYEPDVRALVRRHPSIDLGLWPNFAAPLEVIAD